jgi:nucleoid DNA-binding protein
MKISTKTTSDNTAYKSDLVKRIAKNAGIPVVQAAFIYDVTLDIIEKTLRSGVGIVLPHIGALKLVDVKSTVSNMTGQTIPKHRRLKFTPNVHLARYVRVETRVTKIK